MPADPMPAAASLSHPNSAPSTDSSHPEAAATGLTWSDDGAPRSARFGDVYFSKDDGLAESRTVFLQGCGLPEAWGGRDRFIVAELGFGTGLNIVALLDLWRRARRPGAHLNVFSIEAFPLTAAEASRALSSWPEVADLSDFLTRRWPRGTPGFHRIDLPELSATLDLAIGDAAWALDEWQARADAWFLDGFSPALNPGMWSPRVFAGIAARSAPGARVATFTVAGAVRRGLSEQGFQVEKRPGHGRKRERLEARLPGDGALPTRPTVAVIGAGIAGASVVRALTAAGVRPLLIEDEHPGAGGSGFPSALVTPRLDAGDAEIAAFHAQALNRASDLYGATPGVMLADGVLQLEQADRDPARFAKIAAQPWWTIEQMRPVSADAAAHAVGESQSAGGLRMSGAFAVAPAPVLHAWLAGATRVAGTAAMIASQDVGWRILDAEGETLAEADAVVITAGWGTNGLTPILPLRPVRGQAEWVTTDTSVPPTAWGGYVSPTDDGLLFGATHDRDDTDRTVRPADTLRNREVLAKRLPALAARLAQTPTSARAAIRATTPDRLPICGALDDGLFVLTGLGSRGFCVAPLLGEHIAAAILGSPSPLPGAFSHRLRPDRFPAALADPGRGVNTG